jgi:Domain of unknown function (DUF1707)
MSTETWASTTTPDAPLRMRASDAEREDVVARLHHALGEGRLDLAEAEPRVAAAYAAQYRDELPPLLADLPQAGAAQGRVGDAPTWTELWVSVVWRVNNLLTGVATERPTAGQCRAAAAVAAVAALWTIACAFLGAGLVG